MAFVAVVLALIAFSRTSAKGEIAHRISRLEEEVARLRALVAAGRPATDTGEAPLASASAPVEEATAGSPLTPLPEFPSEPAAESTVAEERFADEAGARRPDSADPPQPGAATREVQPVKSPIEWERWLGVRGAAVLGGAVFALAGLYFFQYSLEHGWIPPWLRVVVGALTGIAALAGAEWSLRQRYAGTANALAGGGLVVLYAAFWAAGALYGLIGPGAVFALMVAVTVTGATLSARHHSLVIAVIGLVGGFLTPFFASRGGDRPIALFAYILLLDLGMIGLARARRWPVLALLSLAGTVIYQTAWILDRMDSSRALLGLTILAVFALVFAFAAPSRRRAQAGGHDLAWRLAQWGGVLLPFGFGAYFASEGDLQVGIVSLGALLALLGAAAGWIAVENHEGRLALASAGATLGVLAAWLVQHDGLGDTPWAAIGILLAVTLAQHFALERRALVEDPATRDPIANAGTVTGAGFLLLLAGVATDSREAFWPLVTGWLGIALVLLRQSSFTGREWVRTVAALGVGMGFAVYRLAQPAFAPLVPELEGLGVATASEVLSPATLLATMVAIAVAWQGFARIPGTDSFRRHGEYAAAGIATVLLLGLVPAPLRGPWTGIGIPLLLGLLVLLAATRLGGGRWMLAGALATALTQTAWIMDLHPAGSLVGFALSFASMATFVLWPALVAPGLREDAWAWRAAALAGVAWLPGLLTAFEDRWGNGAIGLLPLAVGSLTLLTARRASDIWPVEDPRRTSALAWLCGAALGFVTAAIPLQLEQEWITIGWALEGLALTMLWARLDHPGLKYVALGLFVAVFIRLVVNDSVLVYHARGDWRIVNWLAWTYLVPAAAMVLAARRLAALEVARLRERERAWYPREDAFGAGLAGLMALVLVFAWINLTIADWFSTGNEVRIAFDRMPARDLATSISWALYSLLLLALGVRLVSGALRWASLVLLLVTIAKIFLYDLGELEDLYRVASLLGLAVALILVSLVYQRFVFHRSTDQSGATAEERD